MSERPLIRNASIETLECTTLIVIHEKSISHWLKKQSGVRDKFRKKGYQQLIEQLTTTSIEDNYVVELINSITEPKIVKLTADQVLFHEGDRPDNMYIIMQGEMRIALPSKGIKPEKDLILHRGQLFGELGILENKPCSAGAISHTNVALLAIKGDEFKQYLEQNPQIKKIISSLWWNDLVGF